ncbi:MAG TPA: hypothetical protein VIY72_06910 [Acidimicrobiales bacterium]
MISIVLVLGLAACGGGAAANPRQPGETVGGSIRDGSPEAVVVVGRSGELASWSGGSRGGPRWSCWYIDIGPLRGGPPIDEAMGVPYTTPADPVVGQPYALTCFDESGQRTSIQLAVFDPADPFGGVAAVERAMDEARRRLDLPLPEPKVNPPTAQLVGVPTWLWVDGPWQESSATAAIGPVSATVTARPLRVEWDLGDGTTVTCDAGTRYDPSRPPDEQESSCAHVFTTSSHRLPGGQLMVTATVVYAVGWSASTGGGTGTGGDLGELTRSASIPVTVTEAQALIR